MRKLKNIVNQHGSPTHGSFFLPSTGLSFTLRTVRSLKLQCTNDSFLMEAFCIRGSYWKHQTLTPQPVPTISPAGHPPRSVRNTSANGLSLLPNFVQGNKHPSQHSTLTWPCQEQPTHTAWHKWKSWLEQIYGPHPLPCTKTVAYIEPTVPRMGRPL
jgi:hypothetical protein